MVWLREQGYGVHAYCADLGQDEDFAAARAKALKIGAKSVHIEDLREEFLNTYILPAIQANAIYENLYLMGTSLARPCIAKRAVEIAHKMGCGFVAHGATGKGNDQVRFELTFAALDPRLQAIVPWRDPAFFNKFQGRGDLLEYAAKHGVPVVQTKAKPYSCVRPRSETARTARTQRGGARSARGTRRVHGASTRRWLIAALAMAPCGAAARP